MNSQRVHSKPNHTSYQAEKSHPLMMILNLLMLAASAFFVYLVITIWAISEPFETPLSSVHVYGVFFLMLPSFFIGSSHFQVAEEKVRSLILLLSLIVMSLVAYISLQFITLESQFSMPQNLSSKIYIMVSLSHAFLAMVMAIMSCYLVGHFSRSLSNPVLSLLIFTNPFEQLRLTMFVRLLRFTQLSWVVSYLLMLTLV